MRLRELHKVSHRPHLLRGARPPHRSERPRYRNNVTRPRPRRRDTPADRESIRNYRYPRFVNPLSHSCNNDKSTDGPS